MHTVIYTELRNLNDISETANSKSSLFAQNYTISGLFTTVSLLKFTEPNALFSMIHHQSLNIRIYHEDG